MNDAIARAHADLVAGRAWKARDRLNGLLAYRQDVQVLDLLATVHHQMGDLPAAGALWFVTGRADEMARTSIAAWHERYGTDEARWHSVPGPIRRKVRSQRLQSLRGAARRTTDRTMSEGQPYRYTEAWWERILWGGGAIAFLLWVVAMVGIGMFTVIKWIWS